MTEAIKYQADLTMMMQLINADLVRSMTSATQTADSSEAIICHGITDDSRKVKKGSLFVARRGVDSDGRQFIEQAVKNGAAAIVCEAKNIEKFKQVNDCSVTLYSVDKLTSKLGSLSSHFYGNPSHSLTVVGVTGTNGKTSCSQLLAGVVDKLGKKAAVMGTLGNGPVNNIIETGNTTIGAIDLQAHLAEFRDTDIELVSMEVSSHALMQGRVNAVRYSAALFTNLTRDHLDYHGDMESYAKAKKLLLTKSSLKTVAINADDTVGAKLILDDDIKAKKYSFSITPINARQSENSVWTESVVFHDTGIEAEIASPWGSIQFKTSMIGQFNLSNCLAVITTLGAMGYPIKEVAEALASVSFVKGRMERFGGEDKPLVIVDYAHTPDAMKHVLQALKPHTHHKLHCVFGCGGDRDKGKRSEMAKIAEEHADQITFTSDNPRNEAVEDIIDDMLTGLVYPENCVVECDRELAIRQSISQAVLGDVVLIAGKGHEQYQVFGTEKVPFSDEAVVKQALAMGSWK